MSSAVKSTAKCAAMALMLLASGCETSSPGATDALVCAGRTPPPIQPEDVDALSDPLALWLAGEVEFGRKKCGW